jgi:hypothetical protein
MHSIYSNKDQALKEKSSTIERLAFVFVVDVTADPTKFKQVTNYFIRKN